MMLREEDIRHEMDNIRFNIKYLLMEIINIVLELILISSLYWYKNNFAINTIVKTLFASTLISSSIVAISKKRFMKKAAKYFKMWKSKIEIFLNILYVVNNVIFCIYIYCIHILGMENDSYIILSLFIINVMIIYTNICNFFQLEEISSNLPFYLKKGMTKNLFSDFLDHPEQFNDNFLYIDLVNYNSRYSKYIFRIKYSSQSFMSNERRKEWIKVLSNLDFADYGQLKYRIESNLNSKISFKSGINRVNKFIDILVGLISVITIKKNNTNIFKI